VRRALFVLALLLGGPGTASAATEITFGSRPAVPKFSAEVVFSGVVTTNGAPAAGEPVDLIADTGSGWTILGSTTTEADGRYAFATSASTPGSYAAQTPGATSAARVLTLKPLLSARITGLRYPGSRLLIRGRLRPARAGTLTLRAGGQTRSVRVRSGGWFRAPLPVNRPGGFRARLRVRPAAGWVSVVRRRHYRLRAPYLAVGSRGKAVRALERRLQGLHYRLRRVNSYYGSDTYEAVLAFQKVHWLSRSGRVDREVWTKLARVHVPKARAARGDHIEVDKRRQVLFEVRRGKVVRVIHVSTGTTGNTPLGRYHVYYKSPGLLPSGMYYSLFWFRAFAIHGYPSVPPWPASHGCVRIPMWQAPALFSRWGLGTTVYVYT
jgi:L,D-transpeptidase catalytic domain/Putative peptidoglycan binding domain